MTISDIMTTPVVTVDMDDSLAEIKHIFDNVRFHHLLVVEGDTLVGVISDRDLLRAISPNIGTAAETQRDAFTLTKRAHQIMSRDLVTLRPDSSYKDALQRFYQHTISCLPVIDSDRQPLGIVSWRDLVKAVVESPEF